jgi:Metallo-beta-lactamase superfamily
MKTTSLLIGLLLLIGLNAGVDSQEPIAISSDSLRVILLGTAGGPTIDAQRLGISTLILAGPERLLFDCGRGLTTGLARLAINPADVTKVFLTHLHSDHSCPSPNSICFPGRLKVEPCH